MSRPPLPPSAAASILRLARGAMLLGAAFTGLFMLIPTGWACWGHHTHRANLRACFANQKTVAGAVEMYQLDFGVELERLDPATRESLIREGYLYDFPSDPGHGSGTEDHYVLLPGTSAGIACTRHGTIRGYRGDLHPGPREQVEALGVTDPTILARFRSEIQVRASPTLLGVEVPPSLLRAAQRTGMLVLTGAWILHALTLL